MKRSRLNHGSSSRRQRLIKENKGNIIVDIRKMTEKEAEENGWDITNRVAPVIVLDDGTKIFPSSDEEGNNVGMLFGKKGNKSFYIFPQKKKK